MSNDYPSIKEVCDIVNDLNCGFNDVVWNSFHCDEIPLPFSVKTDGNYILVMCLGDNVWSCEDDTRKTFGEEDTYEDLRGYLVESLKVKVKLLMSFLTEVK